LGTVVLVAGALVLGTEEQAFAQGRGGGEAFGSLSTDVFTTTFDVHQYSSDPHDADGYVRAHPGPPGTPVLDGLGARGHVTCVDIEGNKVGVIYTIEAGSEPAALRGQVIYAAGVPGPGHTGTARRRHGSSGTKRYSELTGPPSLVTLLMRYRARAEPRARMGSTA
jgi:hypothetical protein